MPAKFKIRGNCQTFLVAKFGNSGLRSCCESDYRTVKTPNLMSSLLVFKRVFRLEMQSVSRPALWTIAPKRVFRLEMQSVSRPALWTIAPLLFTSPPSPLPKVKVQYIQTVCGWEGVGGGGGYWVVLETRYSAGVYHSVSDQIPNPTKLPYHPETKT